MDPLSATASIIAVLQLSENVLGSCYRFIGKVKEAASDIDRVIHQVGALSVILQDLKSRADDGVPELSATARSLQHLTGDHGPLAVCANNLEVLKLRLPSGPVGLRQKLQWPFESKKINEIMDRIATQIPILELALLGDNYNLTFKIDASLEDTRRREQREKVLNWLRCADPTVKHLASRELHQQDSNQWIFESESFKQWKDKAGQTLWLHGIPGAGKTILCSTIIDHVEALCKPKTERRLAYFYFDFSDQDTQRLETLLRCLIWQLCSCEEYLHTAIWNLYESCDNGRKQLSDKVLAEAFFSILSQDPGRQDYIIIDALDEYPTDRRHNFYELFLDCIEKHRQTLTANFLFTSRRLPDIEERINGIKTNLYSVPILIGDVSRDIRLHVSRFISDNRNMKDWPKDLKAEVEDTISNKSHGMFQWAVCQLDLIKGCKQAGRVRKALKDLPASLEDTYDRILLAIPDETWEIARTALMLLAYSVRPLTLKELAEGMIVDYENHCFDPGEQRLTNYRHVLEICSSLVSVSTTKFDTWNTPWLVDKYAIERWPGSISSYRETPFEIAQFSHFSVKEYMMLEHAESPLKIARFRLSPLVAHRAIAELLLVYLLQFSGGVRLIKFDFNAFPFLAYAAQHWPEHWRRQLSVKDQETINGLIRRILNSEQDHSAYVNYLNICRPDAFVDQNNRWDFGARMKQVRHLDSVPQPLYYAAQLGHYQLCEWLLGEGSCNVNAVGGTFGQVIQIAARFGHTDVVRLLLERGAHVDKSYGKHGYPLQAAAFGGHVDVIKVLLRYGAAVNAVGGEHGSALIAACAQGHLNAASELLDHGADMDIVRVFEGKALNIAAGTGNKTLLQLLLCKGANINDTCNNHGGALYSAALRGDLEMVKMLVTGGADVNLRSGPMCNPLQAACSNSSMDNGKGDGQRYVDVVRFFLQHGADPNMHGGVYGDALQAALVGPARSHTIEIVRLLLEYGADIGYRGGRHGSAMRACVVHGNVASAHLLIERGAELDDDIFLLAIETKLKTVITHLVEKGVNVNAQNTSGTALQLAIEIEDDATTQTLLSHTDIDVNAIGGTNRGITALYLAVKAGRIDIVRQLLEHGADVNQLSNSSTCLVAAVRRADMAMAQLLLLHGADINAALPGMITALGAACRQKDEMFAQFLLDQGADVCLWVLDEGDALQQAAFSGNEDIVKLLLARGADVKAPEGFNGSCLDCAISSEHPLLPQLLLDAGADVNPIRSRQDLFRGPLCTSIECKRYELMRELVERGADVNWPRHPSCETPLEKAVSLDNEAAAKFLLYHGADVNLVGGRYGCALSYAILDRNNLRTCDKYMQILLDAGADVNLQGGIEFGCPLGAAVGTGNMKTVTKLLDLGARINVPAGRYTSPLHISIFEGDLDIFRILMSRGANPNIVHPTPGTIWGCATPLACAAWKSQNTILQELLKYGADPRLADSVAVQYAAMAGNYDGLLMLIESGADIHVQQGVPGLALHEAARYGNVEVLKFFLEKGVDVNAFGGKYGYASIKSLGSTLSDGSLLSITRLYLPIGSNALMAVLENTSWKPNESNNIVQILLDAGIRVKSPPSKRHTSPLQAAIYGFASKPGIADRLLDAGADIHAYDSRFGTALSAAAYHGRLKLVQELVAGGADLALAGDECGNPLHAASGGHHLDVVEYLLSSGANVNQLSGKKGYALHAASCRESEDGFKVIKMLLDHGADPNARGGKYETALQAAAKHGHLRNVKLLLSSGADLSVEGGEYGSPLKASMAEDKHYHVANFLKRYMALDSVTGLSAPAP